MSEPSREQVEAWLTLLTATDSEGTTQWHIARSWLEMRRLLEGYVSPTCACEGCIEARAFLERTK